MHKITSLELLRTPETDFMSLSFFAEKVILELNTQNTSLELLRTPILCLVQLSKLRECEATDA